MKISTKGRYALRAMIDIAQFQQDGYVPLKDISIRQDISVKYLEQIISQLNKAGFIKSTRGTKGGYRLNREPEDIRVGEIITLLEGELAPVSCNSDKEHICPIFENCKTAEFWRGLYVTVNKYTNSYTLKDLL